MRGSELYITGGILGHAFLDRGLLSDYTVNGDVVKAFIAFFPSKDQAVKALNHYTDYLNRSGAQWETRKEFGENGSVSQEPYHKTVLVAQQGTFVVGIADLSHAQKGEPLLKRMLSTLLQIHPVRILLQSKPVPPKRKYRILHISSKPFNCWKNL